MNEQNASGFGVRLKQVFGDVQNQEIAERLGVSKSAITAYLRGSTMPTAGSLVEIAGMTGCNIHWLLTGEGPRWVAHATEGSAGGFRPRTIMVGNLEGGTGKSVTAVFLAMSLARKGHRVLLLDTVAKHCLSFFASAPSDPIWGRTTSVGGGAGWSGSTGVTFLHTEVDNLDLCVPIEQRNAPVTSRVKVFRSGALRVSTEYSYVIIDTLPTVAIDLGHPLAASLAVTGEFLIPCDADRGIHGARRLLEYIEECRQQSLEYEVLGAFVCRVRRDQVRASSELMRDLQKMMPGKLLQTEVSFSRKLGDEYRDALPLRHTNLRSGIWAEYEALADEIIDRRG